MSKNQSRYRWFVVGVFFTFMLLHQLDQLLIGPLTPQIMDEFHINTLQMPESNVKIIIKDSGIGIDANMLPHIFERFYKANEARPSGQSGTGLGLSIARRIVEMHGGSIEAESTVGVGSTFTITLPIGQ